MKQTVVISNRVEMLVVECGSSLYAVRLDIHKQLASDCVNVGEFTGWCGWTQLSVPNTRHEVVPAGNALNHAAIHFKLCISKSLFVQ